MGQRFSVSQIGGLQSRLSTVETKVETLIGSQDTACIKVGQYVFATLFCGGAHCNCAVSCFGLSCCCLIFMGECVKGCDLLPYGFQVTGAAGGNAPVCTPYTPGGTSHCCTAVCACCGFRCNFSLGGASTVYAAYGFGGKQGDNQVATLWRRVC